MHHLGVRYRFGFYTMLHVHIDQVLLKQACQRISHIASRQREQANRDKLRRPPGLPLHLPSVQPSSDAIDDNDYLLFESKHGLLDVIIDSQRWTMI